MGTSILRFSSQKCTESMPTSSLPTPIGRQQLTVELVPRTCWYSNVRSEVSPADWERCKRFVAERSGNRCEICGERGPRWPVECHEIWEYEEHGYIQRLAGLIALCPQCHQVKHIGLAEVRGNFVPAIQHLAYVNQWDEEETYAHLASAYATWEERSQHQWDLDISYLEEMLG